MDYKGNHGGHGRWSLRAWDRTQQLKISALTEFLVTTKGRKFFTIIGTC